MTLAKKVALCVLCFGAILFGLAACSSDPVNVPDVTGMTYEEAETVLKEAGISNGKINKVKEDGSKATVIDKTNWIIISQDPEPNTEISGSDKVTLTVKKSSDIEKEEKTKDQDEKKRAEEEEETQAVETENKIAELKGQSYTTAYDELSAMGYTIKWVHSASDQDFTETVELSIASPDPEFDLPWVIVDYKSLDTKKKTVTLTINTQENLDSAAAANAMAQALQEKLDVSAAWVAAESYGKSQYPYGFKLKDIMGRLAETPEDENTWFLKATCDVTNEYGAKIKDAVCEAKVTGTTDNPQVIYFIVY